MLAAVWRAVPAPHPQEEEAEQMLAPEDFVTEEERLREEREAAYAAEAAEVRWAGHRAWVQGVRVYEAKQTPPSGIMASRCLCRPCLDLA